MLNDSHHSAEALGALTSVGFVVACGFAVFNARGVQPGCGACIDTIGHSTVLQKKNEQPRMMRLESVVCLIGAIKSYFDEIMFLDCFFFC